MAAPVLPSLTAIQARKARLSLAAFFRYSWHVLEPPETPLVWNWHLQVVCDHFQALLEGRLAKNNLAVSIPPGSSKSRIMAVAMPAWWWIDHPSWRSIFSSGNPRVATRDSLNCRTLIESDWYQSWFRPSWKLASDQNVKMLYKNTAGGYRQALSSNAKVTGDRADFLGMDDLLDAAEGESRTARESITTWYDQAFGSRLNNIRTGKRAMIAQRLHEGDPLGHVMKSGDWELLSIAAEYKAPKAPPPTEDNPNPVAPPKHVTSLGWSDPRNEDDELLDPVRLPAEVLAAEKRRLGTRGYAAQYLQMPAPAEGAIIKRAWLQSYRTPKGDDGQPLAPTLLCKALGITQIVQGVDTALTTKTQSDNTADVTIGVAPSRYYILDVYAEKVEAPVAKRDIAMLQAKWGATAVVIEGGSAHSGKAIVQEFRRETTLPVIEVTPSIDKVAAMNVVAPTVEAMTVYVPDDQPWSADFIEWLCTFPAGLHDDVPDAFRLALGYIVTGGGGMGMWEWMRRQADAAKSERPTS